MKEKIITGLDIGSSVIRVVVAKKILDKPLQVIGLAEVPSDGIRRGVVDNVEDAVSSVARALDRAEKMVSFPIESVFASISGGHIISQSVKGIIAVSRVDGEISEEDVQRVLEAAQASSSRHNYETIHIIPKEYTIDSQKHLKEPVGMVGVRLEVEALIIRGLLGHVRNLLKVVQRTTVEVNDLVLTSLSSGEAVLNKKQKDLGVAVLNIGGSTTSLAVYEEGDVIHTAVLPVGSNHITNDIAMGLRVSLDTAEEVKLRYGACVKKNVAKKDERLNLSEISEQESGVVLYNNVVNVIQARVEEIFKLADKELAAVSRSGKLPAGIIITGAGAKLEGIVELGRKMFRLPVEIGLPQNITTVIDKVNDPSFSSAVGLTIWGDQVVSNQGFEVGWLPKFANVGKVATHCKSWFQKLLP